MNADEPERALWEQVFDRCDTHTCCRANTLHRPRCPRRAEHLAERRARAAGILLVPTSIDYPEADPPAGVGSGWWWIQFAVALLATLAAAAALTCWVVH